MSHKEIRSSAVMLANNRKTFIVHLQSNQRIKETNQTHL